MDAYRTYRQHSALGGTRIDVLLAGYDGLIDWIGQARTALEQGDRQKSSLLLCRSQLLISALAGGLDLRYGVVPENLLRLYEFVGYRIREGKATALADALRVLEIVREAFRAIRSEAAELERTGRIPPLGGTRAVHACA